VTLEGVEIKDVEIEVDTGTRKGKSAFDLWGTAPVVENGGSLSNGNGRNQGSPSLTISGCNFTTVISGSVSGGVFFISLPPSHALSVSEVRIEGCVCAAGTNPSDSITYGRGGGIYLSVDETLSSISFSFDDFTENGGHFVGNKASKGKDIYLTCKNLIAVVPENFSFMGEIDEEDRGDRFWGIDETNMETEEDLFFFFRKYSKELIYVNGSGGIDSLYCGRNIVPCGTATVALSHLHVVTPTPPQRSGIEDFVYSKMVVTGIVPVNTKIVKGDVEVEGDMIESVMNGKLSFGKRDPEVVE
jgi:hypothetical protein